MPAHRYIAAFRRLTHDRQLVDFALRGSQSVANDATVAEAALGASEQRRSVREHEDLEPIGQSLFGDSDWNAAPAPNSQPVSSLSQSFAELNRAAAAVPRPAERAPQVTNNPSLNRFVTPMLHQLGGAAPAALMGSGPSFSSGPSLLHQAASFSTSALAEMEWKIIGRQVLKSMYSEMGVGDVDYRSRYVN